MANIRDILAHRLAELRGRMAAACARAGRQPDSVTLVGVTKTVGHEVAQALVDLGVPDLGENRPQELWRKAGLVTGARWHAIGHLQRNKVERTLPLVSLIHSCDSIRLLEAVDAEALSQGTTARVLLEVNCSGEDAKQGFNPAEVPALAERLNAMKGILVDGLMTMAALAGNPDEARPAFRGLATLARDLKALVDPRHTLAHLSMGMSNDFEVAIEEGATLIRLGTILVGGLEPA
jgi:PLP dependent protein